MKATDELLKQIKELNIEDFKKQESFDCISIDEYLCSLLTSHNLQPKDIIPVSYTHLTLPTILRV